MTNPGGVEDLRRGASCGGRVPIAIAALLLVLTGMAVSGISGTPTARACCGSTPFTHRFETGGSPSGSGGGSNVWTWSLIMPNGVSFCSLQDRPRVSLLAHPGHPLTP